MIEIVNRQRKIKIDAEIFRDFADKTVSLIPEASGKSVVIAFVSDSKMRQLNAEFRGKDLTTDVLSFPFEADEFETDQNTLGDVAISLEQAHRQAIENDLTFPTEIKQLILHGILHLCGYNHETDNGEMNSLELKLRDKLLIG
ncbi:MAG: rRNA maturation RNase YbeY [Acidobacteriota bacterium]|nr:rRNA maturation RNase YbeY [Acidobacteriota bacterium]